MIPWSRIRSPAACLLRRRRRTRETSLRTPKMLVGERRAMSACQVCAGSRRARCGGRRGRRGWLSADRDPPEVRPRQTPVGAYWCDQRYAVELGDLRPVPWDERQPERDREPVAAVQPSRGGGSQPDRDGYRAGPFDDEAERLYGGGRGRRCPVLRSRSEQPREQLPGPGTNTVTPPPGPEPRTPSGTIGLTSTVRARRPVRSRRRPAPARSRGRRSTLPRATT